MKIKLINPPSHFLMNEKVFPSLGLLKIGASLEKYNYDVSCIDLAGVYEWETILKKELIGVNYVGITSVTPQIPEVVKICKYIKNNFNTKIIIGGPHVTMSYSSIKNGSDRAKENFNQLSKFVDKIVIGYGELAIIAALNSNEKIIDSEVDDNLKFTNKVYEDIPIPSRHLIDLESYKYEIDNQKSTSLICQLGCPYGCSFCGGRLSDTYRKIKTRPIETVIDEIDMLIKKYNYRGFMFYDDEINVSSNSFNIFLETLIKYQKDNQINLSLRGFTRSDLITDKQASLMSKAGFKWLLVGFESGSNRILQNMNKKTTVEQNSEVFNIAKRNNLKVKALMSIGHPGESEETINETKNWVLKVKPDETDFTIITLYPGSPYYDQSVFENKWIFTSKLGDKLYSDDADFINEEFYYKSKEDNYFCHVYTDYLSKEKIIHLRNLLEKEIRRI